jgi:hypothetical protein
VNFATPVIPAARGGEQGAITSTATGHSKEGSPFVLTVSPPRNLRSIVLAALLAVLLVGALGSTAHAADTPDEQPAIQLVGIGKEACHCSRIQLTDADIANGKTLHLKGEANQDGQWIVRYLTRQNPWIGERIEVGGSRIVDEQLKNPRAGFYVLKWENKSKANATAKLWTPYVVNKS